MADSKYNDYSVEDFAQDDAFRQAALAPGDPQSPFIRELLRAYPEKRDDIEEARNLVRRLHQAFAAEPGMTPELRARLYDNIRHQGAGPRGRVIPWPRPWRWLTVAASFLLVAWFSWSYLSQPGIPREQVYQTNFGETAEIKLPDGTLVSLNANSELRYPQPLPTNGPVEVWLSGEAFFEVTKKPSYERSFVVHTKGPDIVVLGTRFNVNTREEETEVVLEEGSIRLDQPADRMAAMPVKELKPGELARYSPRAGLRIESDIKTENHSSWKDGYLLIEGYSFSALLKRVESLYGVKIQLAEDIENANRVRGALPTRSLEETIETLQALYHVQVTRKSDSLFIEPLQ